MRVAGKLGVILTIAAGVLFAVLSSPISFVVLGGLSMGALIWAAGGILDGFADGIAS
jgi:hypothetical protein